MLSFIEFFLPTHYLPWWLVLDVNPLYGILQGLVGACGISVLSSILRIHLFLEDESKREKNGTVKEKVRPQTGVVGLAGTLQFVCVAAVLAVVGHRVASLVVLEFCLRAVSGALTAGPDSRRFLKLLLVQSQLSLGCALSSSLHFLHEGAPQQWLCLLLAAALSWYLSRLATGMQQHVLALFRLHSSQRYCGTCLGLLTAGHWLLPGLCRALLGAFVVASVAAVSVINQHFLSAAEALRFWTPLTICYTLLVVYMQEEQRLPRSPAALLHTVMVRLGGLMVLMLTVGRWSDLLHILMCFLGEAICLIFSRDLLDTVLLQEDEKMPNVKRAQQKTHRARETQR